jgi:hypothetical protein
VNFTNLWGKVFCFVLFITLKSLKLGHFMPHSWYFGRTHDEYGCIDLVWDYLGLWCGICWLLNHFFNEN